MSEEKKSVIKDQFYKRNRYPSWMTAEPGTMSAVEAYTRYAPVELSLTPTFTEWNGMHMELESKAVIMHPVPGHTTQPQKIAVVNKGYQILQPRRIAEIIDQEIARPVDTAGMLPNGTVFWSFKNDGYDVAGDEVLPYTIILAPADGKRAYTVALSAYRMVCMNVLVGKSEDSLQTFKVRHNQYAEVDLIESLQFAMAKVGQTNVTIQDIFNQFASTDLTVAAADSLIEDIFPLPGAPKVSHIKRITEQNEDAHEKKVARQWALRHATQKVFEGDSYEARNGYHAEGWNTAWGIYNAATEVIQYGGSNVKNKADRPLFNHNVRNELAFAFEAVQEAVR